MCVVSDGVLRLALARYGQDWRFATAADHKRHAAEDLACDVCGKCLGTTPLIVAST